MKLPGSFVMRRSFALIAVFSMLLMSLTMIVPGHSEAYYLYDAQNTTSTIPDEKNILFYTDFSQESVGYFEIGHKENYGSVNRTIDIVNLGGDIGKCLRMNVSGAAGMSGTYVGGWNIGHKIDSGLVYLDYKLNIEYYGGGSAGYILFGLGDGRTYYTSDIMTLEFAKYNHYISEMNDVRIDYVNDSLKKTWVDVHCEINMDTDVCKLYINDVLISSGTFLESRIMTHFFVEMYALTSIGYYRQALIDDICLYTDKKQVEASSGIVPLQTSIGFTFDDNEVSIYDNVFPKMRNAQIEASMAVVSGWVGGVNKTTWAQLDEMVDAGWELMGHSMTHADHATLSEADIIYQMDMCRSAIIDNTSVSQVNGYIFPGNSYNALGLSIGWDRFDYLGAPGYDLDRYWITSIGPAPMDNYKLTSLIMCSKYSYGGHLELYSHGVYEGATGSNIDLDAWNYLIDRLIANNSRVITHNDAIITRNANAASISGNATAFSVEYPTDIGNFRNSSVWVHIAGNFSDDTYVAVSGGEIIDTASPTDGNLTMLLVSGDYRIMTLAEYRSQQMNDAISPIFAIIPIVVIVGIIPMVMGIGKKLK